MKRCLLTACFALGSCLQIEIPLPMIDPPADPPRGGTCLVVNVTGADAPRSDWTYAYAVSGIVRRRVENRSGSLASITKSAIENLAMGYGIRPGVDCPADLHFEFTKTISVWQPPREFIEGPRARRPGKIVVQFEGRARFQEKSRVRESELVFVERRQNAVPGEEADVLATENVAALRELLVKTAAPILATR